MIAVFENLGGDVGGCTAEGGGEGFLAYDLREAEIGEFDVQGFGQEEDVFGFDVAGDDVAFMLEQSVGVSWGVLPVGRMQGKAGERKGREDAPDTSIKVRK